MTRFFRTSYASIGHASRENRLKCKQGREGHTGWMGSCLKWGQPALFHDISDLLILAQNEGIGIRFFDEKRVQQPAHGELLNVEFGV